MSGAGEWQGYCWPALGEPCGQCHRCGSPKAIPAEAVEAAVQAIYEHANLGAPWGDAAPDWREAYRASVLAGLEAAAPHMLAEAWQAGHAAGDWDQSAMWEARNAGKPAKYADIATPNPYRPNDAV